MADCLAARLTAQEEQIRLLTAEISALRDGLNGGTNRVRVAVVSPELENLRSENEKLRYRLLHLRRGLQAELEMEEAAQGRKQPEAKCGKTPEKNTKKHQQTDRRADNRVPIPDKKPSEKNKKDKKQDKEQVDGGVKKLNPWPPYVPERLSLYEELKKESDALLVKKAAESKPIVVELTDGQKVPGKSWVTTPYQLACDISQSLGDSAVISRVNGELWDLDRPLEQDCSLEILRFDNEDAQAVYWHSSAHILGEAMERFYGGCLCYGPPIENGFYYDMFLDGQKSVSSTEFGDLEALWFKGCFFFHDLSPGSCFFMPRGAYVYNTLTEFIRDEYWRRGFQEVASPNIYNSKLWETSGHWQHYSENMFSFPVEDDIFALKPMNCPGHCLMFSHRPRSWRELPLRLADFGVLHRNELSGTLTGLTRVRRFQQDDSHIFCLMDQIESEMKGCLDFLRCVYDVFGFSFQLYLSTRPEKYLGDIAVWDQAEKQLESSLNEFGEPWKLNPGDGAFYGPKIDIKIKDAIGRYHQCATIQLDFQLPIRFNLTFVGKDGDDTARPVIIHRAILGSVERMIAILTENYAGKWPLWLSPRQVMLVPVNPSCEDYANKVCKQFTEAGFMADADLDSGCLLNKKIRNAQLAQYNFILVVGEKEKITNSVNVRTRDNKVHGELPVSEVIARLTLLKQSRCRSAEEEF
ncbi:hypothetical protein CRENBAI_004791 [Crenichthys baileyi]|uniref:threonine--tRNA ligase n=1 Tax=Crenichthys baileyi TaxID=28760 RepID=A0AAV9R295_9TELE